MKIITAPATILKAKAKEVRNWDKKTIKEVQEMQKLLKAAHDPEGVGLAATQVGLDKRIFIVTVKDAPIVFVNPTITVRSKKMISQVYKKKSDRWLEGCLSLPRLWGFVDRHYSITVEFQTPDPKDETKLIDDKRIFTDVEAAYIQHEYDHLDGILFTDRILEQKGIIYQETDGKLNPLNQ